MNDLLNKILCICVGSQFLLGITTIMSNEIIENWKKSEIDIVSDHLLF